MTKYYTEEHEWISVAGNVATLGITDHAQAQLGDVVFVEVPTVGRKVKKGEETAVVESVKAASEVYSPVTGTVVEANDPLADSPITVNEDPEGAGWFCRIEMSDPAELEVLMDEATYKAFVAGL
ncbi:glycine cleavage complex lipoylprotein [uncultured Pleomorphomonas sp.]|uniref:Glycine cleavage system H protein n=1 Tax=uncultured Pleomorphomonas sp. TaxID=442121 RepID=A0A212LGD8_9HYPH|nr:glycine cleavage system protein GcvH [uncultured Pleomorphomonas sp.]SCM76624.1 glycine cleavage complex lipoylprotein [uncultured Pleomorphomonas sp.]